MLQSLGAWIRLETSASADAYARLTGNTAVGEEWSSRAWPPPGEVADRSREQGR